MKKPQIILELGHDIIGPDIVQVLDVKIENATPEEIVEMLKMFFTQYVQHSIAMNADFDALVTSETSKIPMFEHRECE